MELNEALQFYMIYYLYLRTQITCKFMKTIQVYMYISTYMNIPIKNWQ